MNWWQRLMHGRRVERQLDAELRFHLERLIADNLATGMTADEARREACLAFGGLDQAKEACRDVRGTRWVESIVQDIRLTCRMLRSAPLRRQAIELGLTPGFGCFPLCGQQTSVLQTMKRRVQGTLLHLHDVAGDLLHPPGDCVTVNGLERDDLQDQHVERALRQIRPERHVDTLSFYLCTRTL